MRAKYDVIVVGAGPAGTSAAYTLACDGNAVLLVDSAVFPREKLCGGLLSRKSINFIKGLYGKDLCALSRSGVLEYVSEGYEIVSKGKIISEGQSRIPFYFVRRNIFDNWLMKQATTAGVTTLTGVGVTECDIRSKTLTLTDGRLLQGRFIIGADGVHSKIRKNVPHNRTRWRRGLASTIEIRFSREEYPALVYRPSIHLGYVPYGYGWVFPNKDSVLVGLGGKLTRGQNLAEFFRIFLGSLGVDTENLPQFRGAPLPYGNYLDHPYCGNVLLAGDAAGFVEPLFGEGIFWAMSSGQAAGAAVSKALKSGICAGAEYVRSLQGVYRELSCSLRLQQLVYAFNGGHGLNIFSAYALRFGPGVFLDLIHGQRSYHFLRKQPFV